MVEKFNQSISKNTRLRVVLEPNSRKNFFDQIRTVENGISLAAQTVGVSERTIRDWSRGAHLPSQAAIQLLARAFCIKTPEVISYIDELELKRNAARFGALARNNKYGNPGTVEGRKKGGKKAITVLRRRNDHRFVLAKPTTKPKRSSKLAELIGIILGDGSISNYQITVSLNNTTDRDYAIYTGDLLKELFDLMPSYCIRQEINTITVVISSVKAVRFLESYGLAKGHKINNKTDMPKWIIENDTYTKMCLRGLFDTDGCVYIDKHRYNDKVYLNIGVDFTSYSDKLLYTYFTALRKFGLQPTQHTKNSIKLRRASDISKFFRIVGTSNLKHKTRYNNFLKARGEVA